MVSLSQALSASDPASSRFRSVVLVALVVILAFLPPLLLASLWLKVLTGVAIYTLTAAAIALLYRRLGLVSLLTCWPVVSLQPVSAWSSPIRRSGCAGFIWPSSR